MGRPPWGSKEPAAGSTSVMSPINDDRGRQLDQSVGQNHASKLSAIAFSKVKLSPTPIRRRW
ncbi:MAG: hypothetical protein JNK05_25560 [Myxococcales bacterium]|nr:hypothetical protein [Myxococcales bacterium]